MLSVARVRIARGKEKLLPLVYAELRKLARIKLSNEKPGDCQMALASWLVCSRTKCNGTAIILDRDCYGITEITGLTIVW